MELHVFVGFTFQEIASTLGVSKETVKRDWSFAKLWLRRTLTKGINHAG